MVTKWREVEEKGRLWRIFQVRGAVVEGKGRQR